MAENTHEQPEPGALTGHFRAIRELMPLRHPMPANENRNIPDLTIMSARDIDSYAARLAQGNEETKRIIKPILEGWQADQRRIVLMELRVRDLERTNAAFKRVATNWEEKAKAWEQTAHTDELTKIPNRRHFMTMLQNLINEQRGTLKTESFGGGLPQYAVVFIDLNKFKAINDTWGHEVGDAVLLTFTERLRSLRRSDEQVARLGGDEFVLLLSSESDPNFAENTKQRLQEGLKDLVYNYEETPGVFIPIPIHCSIGIEKVDITKSPHALLKGADEKMYQDKQGQAGATEPPVSPT